MNTALCSAQLEAEAKIERQLNQVAADQGILPAALPDIRERILKARPSDVPAYVATFKESAPHLFGSMPSALGYRGGAGPSTPKAFGAVSGAPLSLTAIAEIKDERERAKQLQALMDAERGRER